MAAPAPGPSGAALPAQSDSQSAQPLNWEGDRMFNIYIYDYCTKRGFLKTAKEFHEEADLGTDDKAPIDAKQGLLFEWWIVFWALFTAKNGTGQGQTSEDAQTYVENQARIAQRRQQLSMPGGHIMGPRGPMLNGMQPRIPGGSFPNGHMVNGAGPGHPMINGANGFPMPQANGVLPGGMHPGPPGPPNQPPMVRPMNAMPGRSMQNGVPPPFQSPSAPGGSSPAAGGQQPGPPGQRPPGLGAMPPPAMTPTHNGIPGEPPTPTSAQFPQHSQQGGSSSRAPTPNNGHAHAQQPNAGGSTPAAELQNQQLNSLQLDMAKIPPEQLVRLQVEMGLEKKHQSQLTMEERQSIIARWKQRSASISLQPAAPIRGGNKPQMNNAPAGPSNMPPPGGRNVSRANSNKRASTSPGEDNDVKQENSPPASKRPRRSPNGEGPQPFPGHQLQPGQGPPPPHPSPMMGVGPPGSSGGGGPHHPPQQPQPHSSPMQQHPGHSTPQPQPMSQFPMQNGIPQQGGRPQMGFPQPGQQGMPMPYHMGSGQHLPPNMMPANMMNLNTGLPPMQQLRAMQMHQQQQQQQLQKGGGHMAPSPSADGSVGPPGQQQQQHPFPGPSSNMHQAQNRTAMMMKNMGPPPSPTKAPTPKDSGNNSADTPTHMSVSPHVANSSVPQSSSTPSALNGPPTPANAGGPAPSPRLANTRVPTPATSAPPTGNTGPPPPPQPTATPGLPNSQQPPPLAATPKPPASAPPTTQPQQQPQTVNPLSILGSTDPEWDVMQQGIFGEAMDMFNIDDWFNIDAGGDQPAGSLGVE